MSNTATLTPPTVRLNPDPDMILRVIAGRSFANLSTVSSGDRPHVAGVAYVLVGRDLYVSTERETRKARNISGNPRVAMSIPVRRVPFGPPAQIQFQTTAEMLAVDSGEVRELLDRGLLKKVTSHGELDLPGACFLRIPLPERIPTYGLGLSIMQWARNPLDAAGVVTL